jgi:ornithine--oxo-acid transaminase
MGDLFELETQLRKGDVAALIVELIQGKTVKWGQGDFYQKAQELCRKYGALFIADEVQTGLGRTGKWFAYEHWGLEPDILTLSKALSCGYVPCGAIITRRAIYQKTFDRLDRCIVHSTTFGRNNLAAACGLAALNILEEEKLVENAARMGAYLEAGLLRIKERNEFVKDVRVKGLMAAIEFGEPDSFTGKMAWKAIHALDASLFPQLIVTPMLAKHRIVTQVAANKADIVKILPPLISTEKEIDRFLVAFEQVLGELKSPAPLLEMGKNFMKSMKSGAPKDNEPVEVGA